MESMLRICIDVVFSKTDVIRIWMNYNVPVFCRHDVAEVAGVPAFSIGEEGVDRHVMIFKRECTPSDDELAALRRGEEWDPEKAKLLAQKVYFFSFRKTKTWYMGQLVVYSQNYYAWERATDITG